MQYSSRRVGLHRDDRGSALTAFFFFSGALLRNMFPFLGRCICFRNCETKDIERLNGLIKVSSELKTKIYEYELNIMLLFIQTLKYMI